MLYTVSLKNFDIEASIGVHDFERKEKQRLLINITLLLETDGRSDRIEGVVDYDFLREEVKEIVSTGHIDLQETLCLRILNICMEKESVKGARVSTEKPDVYKDCEGVGCQMASVKDGVEAPQFGF